MNNSILKATAIEAARKLGPPSFYSLQREELDESHRFFSNSELLQRCRSYLDESKLHPAHGIFHCEKVALEAGAILLIESSRSKHSASERKEMLLCVQMAGLLHDIKRNEKDHTISGSIEAGRILDELDIGPDCRQYVTAAIRNHEAFRKVLDSGSGTAKLISDSLYDADKFRWGPDNFTTTLWLIMESTGIPIKTLYSDFQEKMEGIRKIKETFRTETGRKYGPEFIDFGIEIGNEIYKEMKHILGD
ncbi:MAG: hypothetical protein VST72_05155 [Nitrospirota bacterium]|nr:hypothetical protein [Nitrospirota bacterium]